MHDAEFRDLHGQVAIGLEPVLEDLHMAGAVHGLQREDPIVLGLGDEHVLAIGLPMARGLPQGAVEHLGRVDLDIAGRLLATAHVGDEGLEQGPALGMPEDRTRPLFLEMEQIHLAAKAAMVAALGLLDLLQIGVEVFLLGEGGAVDAAEHGAVAVAAPIGARHLHELEGCADLARGGHVRATAQVHPVALPVHLEVLIGGDGLDQLHLEGLALRLEMGDGVGAGPDFLGEGRVAGDQLAHLLLDGLEVIGGEGRLAIKVVIETVLDHRADGDLRARIKRLHRLGQHMGAIVADELERAGILAADEFDFGVLMDGIGEIDHRAIQRHGDGALGERGGDGFGDLEAGDARRELTLRAIGESHGNHMRSLGSLADTSRRKRMKRLYSGGER